MQIGADTELMRDMYPEIEAGVYHLILVHAQKLTSKSSGWFTLEDGVQFGREVVWKALFHVDVNKNEGDIDPFINRCLRNAFASELDRATAQRRMPRVHSQGMDGSFVSHPLPPIQASALGNFWEWSGPEAMSPGKFRFDSGRQRSHPGSATLQHRGTWIAAEPDPIEDREDAAELERCLDVIREGLDVRQRFVLDMMIDPPDELMEVHEALGGDPNGAPTQVAMVHWLYPMMSKNQLDQTMLKLRKAIIEFAERGEFSDAFRGHILRGWTNLGARKRRE